MKKSITITALFILATINLYGQSKPSKVTIKKSITISKDSTYYLPDTIACVFQELVIKPDTVYTKWSKGFVVWQAWNSPLSTLSGISYSDHFVWRNITPEPEPYKNDYRFSDTMPGIFLYPDKTKVINKVIQSY